MWKTPCGERVLKGAEKQLFVLAAGCLIDELNMAKADNDRERSLKVGISAFDSMEFDEQKYAVCLVVKALVDETVPCPIHYAWSEATIAAIIWWATVHIGAEEDRKECDRTFYRLVSMVAKKEGISIRDAKREWEWESVMEEILDLILWDRDFEMVSMPGLLDTPKHQFDLIDQQMGFGDGYFVEQVPNPKGKDLEDGVKFVHELCVQYDRKSKASC